MNIFAVHHNPTIAAQSLCDCHVVKMVLETAQLLSTAYKQMRGTSISEEEKDGLYAETHVNHPAAIWVKSDLENFHWLLDHGWALSDEYTFRYGKVHKTAPIFPRLLNLSLNLSHRALMSYGPSPKNFALCMPNEFKVEDCVQSYRNYYHFKAKTISRFRYTKRSRPEWLNI